MRYLVHRIVRCTAATIAGRKPATLMNISNDNGGLLDAWDHNRADIFSRSEIDYYELKRTEKNAIVLFFNQNLLDELLRNESVNKFLSECGYESDSIDYVLDMLRRRYAIAGCPPEIGVFLGIPLKDVKGFMGLNSLSHTKCKMWRIYGDPVLSEKRMNEYRCARNMIRRRLISGEDPVRIIRGKEFGFLNKPNFIREDYLRT
ncbi:MAG: DUF3793 family protein [Methanosarcinales archaeon]|nr:DUF3793 family protein [Methanosarcinales archaeon]